MKLSAEIPLEEALRHKACYSMVETCYLTARSERTIRRAIKSGHIRPNKGMRKLSFTASEIQLYLEATS